MITGTQLGQRVAWQHPSASRVCRSPAPRPGPGRTRSCPDRALEDFYRSGRPRPSRWNSDAGRAPGHPYAHQLPPPATAS